MSPAHLDTALLHVIRSGQPDPKAIYTLAMCFRTTPHTIEAGEDAVQIISTGSARGSPTLLDGYRSLAFTSDTPQSDKALVLAISPRGFLLG